MEGSAAVGHCIQEIKGTTLFRTIPKLLVPNHLHFFLFLGLYLFLFDHHVKLGDSKVAGFNLALSEDHSTDDRSLVQLGYVPSNMEVTCKDGKKPLKICDAVVDLECHAPWPVAKFHRIFDCLAYEYYGIKQAIRSHTNPCFLGYLDRAQFYSVLLGKEIGLCNDVGVLQAAADERNLTYNLTQHDDHTIPVFAPSRENVTRSVAELLHDLERNSTVSEKNVHHLVGETNGDA